MTDDPKLSGQLIQPVHRCIGDGLWVLEQDFRIEWTRGTIYRRITVPRGAEWNKSSIPRFAWVLKGYERDGPAEAASLVHDMICRDGGYPSTEWHYETTLSYLEPFQTNTSRWELSETNDLFYWMLIWAGIKPRTAATQRRVLNMWLPLRWRYYS